MERSGPGVVVLRNVSAGDVAVFFEHQLDRQASEMAAFPTRDRDTFMAHWSGILGDETVTARTVLVDGQVAGNVVSFLQGGEREVGYWIGRAFWGKGVATAAVSAFLEHVSERPLFAHVAKHNIGSIRVLEKCGFVICGEDRVLADAPDDVVEEWVLRLDGNDRKAWPASQNVAGRTRAGSDGP